MKKVICIVLISNFLITSCSYNINRDEPQTEKEYYEYVNNKCKNKTHLTIETKTGTVFLGKDIILKSDSTYFRLVDEEETKVIPTQNIKTITYSSSLTGARDGFILGTLSGLSLGLLALLTAKSEGGMGGAILATIVLPTAIVIGTLWGLINESETKIEIIEGE